MRWSGSDRSLDYLSRFQAVVEGLSAPDAPGCLGAESSLAQGFKLAACTRPHVLPTAPIEWLAAESRFWYARIEALHALAYEAVARGSSVPETIKRSARSDPHPLVRRVAQLASRAVETGAAERWLWEDEMSVARAPGTSLWPEAVPDGGRCSAAAQPQPERRPGSARPQRPPVHLAAMPHLRRTPIEVDDRPGPR
jgi:hypothetical protein